MPPSIAAAELEQRAFSFHVSDLAFTRRTVTFSWVLTPFHVPLSVEKEKQYEYVITNYNAALGIASSILWGS